MLKWFRKKNESTADDIHGILVTLLVGKEQSLFIMLDSNGSINRAGTGSVDNIENDMFIGRTEPGVFESVRKQVTPELLKWCGQSRTDPNAEGKSCELTVGFKKADGNEMMMIWRYGAESLGPPPEVRNFVVAAIGATKAWYDQQRSMVHHPPRS